uniref:Sugar phosphate transporter domain-containing protein n=1 Tax=Haptolina ericina TaxID=156174 RepID=A0A7S3APD8_9EUKA
MEDTLEAFAQVCDRPQVLILMFGNSFSIAFFNYFGVSITKSSSASYRMVLDSLRTVVIWVFDLASGGGKFHPLQVVGFACMLCGTTVYNEAVQLPCLAYPSVEERSEERARRVQSQSRSRQEPLLLEPFTASPTLKVDEFFTPSLTRYVHAQQ